MLLGAVCAQAVPANDNCADAEPLGNIINLPFDTSEATHDGSGTCMSSPNIWYCYTAPASGNVVVSLCGSSYDTMLAVYNGCSCNPLGTNIDCNDDSPSCGLSSQITFYANEGNTYLIEVGGWSSNTGTGFLSITAQVNWKDEANTRIEQFRKGNFQITTVWADGLNPIPDVTVQINQIKHHFAFGTCINAGYMSDDSYKNFIKNHFGWAVCEDASKWYTNEPSEGGVTYTAADNIYNWCAANDIKIRGHCLYWDVVDYVQNWLQLLDYAPYPTPSHLLTHVESRMNGAMNHFKGKFVHWDVCNEIIYGGFFGDRLGDPIYTWMHQAANAIDPNCKLFVNEYVGNSWGGYYAWPYINLVNNLRSSGAPIHGIGIQGHVEYPFEPERYWNDVLKPLGTLGLPIWVTEFDVGQADKHLRADELENFYRICFSDPNVEGILMWGFYTPSCWRDDWGIVDSGWILNAAGVRYESLMNEWTTEDANTTDNNGNADFRGFYGKYRVTLTSQGTKSAVAFIDVTAAGPSEFTIELTPGPTAPTGLSATAGDKIVWLDWDDSTEPNLAGYNIYRSIISGNDYSKLNTSLLGSSDYTDSNVINGTTYYYIVTVVDTNNNESYDSSEVSVSPAAAVGAMGTILREWWTGIAGGAVSDLTSDPNFPDYPTNIEQIKSLEGPTNWADSYGARISGYLYPPETGSYTFWIASDANSELWLSTDGSPENAQLIASVPSFTNPRQWNKYSQQQSLPISLTSGKKYYIEVLHKEDTGNDNVAVAWQGPGITPRQIIYGTYLSPCSIGFYGDLTDDSKIDMNDLADFIEFWLDDDCQQTSAIDLDGDCIVNFYEFSAMAENWRGNIVPSTPTNLSITAAGAASVSLDWNDNSGSFLAGYNVYRSTASGSGYSRVNSSLVAISNYTDNFVALPDGNTYYYVVTAADIYSNESGYSNEISRLVIQENTTGFCSVNGSISATYSGYTGIGYVDTSNISGVGINWKINIPSDGTYTFAWRFANGSSSDRPARLLVGGSEVVSSISFLPTGGYSTWSLVSANRYLTAGTHSVRLEATGSSGLANIDYLMATGGSASPSSASCP